MTKPEHKLDVTPHCRQNKHLVNKNVCLAVRIFTTGYDGNFNYGVVSSCFKARHFGASLCQGVLGTSEMSGELTWHNDEGGGTGELTGDRLSTAQDLANPLQFSQHKDRTSKIFTQWNYLKKKVLRIFLLSKRLLRYRLNQEIIKVGEWIPRIDPTLLTLF